MAKDIIVTAAGLIEIDGRPYLPQNTIMRKYHITSKRLCDNRARGLPFKVVDEQYYYNEDDLHRYFSGEIGDREDATEPAPEPKPKRGQKAKPSPADYKLSGIAASMSYDDIACQIAEEAAELAHAALKLRRTIIDTNPTPVTYEQALMLLLEEIADVRLTTEVFMCKAGINSAATLTDTMQTKLARWAERLGIPEERATQ